MKLKFALVNGRRQEPQPKLQGECPLCRHPLIAKCGEIRVWHWAHKGTRDCDSWSENETEWHRNWKDQFPADWQEVVVQHSEDGERHRADVKTDDGWAIEFQRSPIRPKDRRARDAFYPKLVWVVDGTTRESDKAQFLKAWRAATPVGAKNPGMRIAFSGKCRLLREWAGSPAPVFFDFPGHNLLPWLLPKKPDDLVYIAHLPRTEFIEIHSGTATQAFRNFDSFVEELSKLVPDEESPRRTQALEGVPPRSPQLVRTPPA